MRPLLRPLAILCLAVAAHAQSHVLVGVDDAWRFTNAPTSAPPASLDGWMLPAFGDAAWPEARSGFGTSGFGEQTLLQGLPGDWKSALFRRAFVVADPARLRSLVLRIDYRDGFVAYLNGREIARRNVVEPPGQPVPFGSLPFPRLAGAAEWIAAGDARALLVPGTNVLAIQVQSDSDLDRPVLVPELLADFPRGPYLQGVGTDRATIVWQSATATPGRLWIGEGDPFASAPIATPAGTNHEATVTGLAPGRAYAYALGTGDGADAAVSDVFRFRAMPASGALSVTVIGDSGSGALPQFSIARQIAREGADVVLHLGDTVYPMLTPELADTRLLSVYRSHMAGTPFAFAWGNHDLYAGTKPFLSVIRPPTNDTPAADHLAAGTLPQSYYSFDAGDVHFVMGYQPYASQYALATNNAQYRWIDADLKATKKPWKVMCFHHPWTTSGNHRYTDVNFNGIIDWMEVGPVMMDLAQRNGVQLLMAGHDHVWERFLPRGGVHSLTTGGGGTVLYALRAYVPDSIQFTPIHHVTRLRFQGDTLEVRAVDANGVVFDGFNVQRAPPPPGPRDAAWTTPVIETRAADNGDGNIVGQTFDLGVAPAIPSLTGAFSNLGLAHVGLDRDNLYLGFESVVVPGDADVYAFLEVPGLPGVTSLAGLGNGGVDPKGEGADGLDLFGNIAFEGFRPSIACLLGDEYADGTSRGFRRPGASTGLGQGVFRLAPGFPSVPGIRLQQFNRSPQDWAAPPEQGADFIELAIPRSALGDLADGATIRLAAIVARGLDPKARTREVDTGYLGASMNGSGTALVTVAGVEVRLPVDPHPGEDFILSLQAAADGSLALGWRATPGHTYDLQEAPAPSGPWQSVPGYPRAAAKKAEEQILAPDAAPRFYRMQYLP